MLFERVRLRGRRVAAVLGVVSVFVLNAAPAGALSNCPPTMVPCRSAWVGGFSGTSPVFGQGDFNGDGADDLLLVQGGGLWFWYGARSQVPTTVPVDAVRIMHTYPMARQLVGTEPVIGDFNGDGVADVLWASVFGSLEDNGQIWYGTSGIGRFQGGPAAGTGHHPDSQALVGDFDGDGGDDVLWYRESDGELMLQLLHGDLNAMQAAPYPDRIGRRLKTVVGDLDANNNDDVVFYDESTGSTALWYFDGGAIDLRRANPGAGLRVRGGDFDGDQRLDLLWYGPGDLVDAYWFGTPQRTFRGGPLAAPVGGNQFPVVADLDGDGRSDIFWWDGAGATDHIWLTRDDGPYVISQELGGVSQLIPTDFDGDGATDLLFFGMRDLFGRATTWTLWWLTSAPAG